jgi:hypothetical protein
VWPADEALEESAHTVVGGAGTGTDRNRSAVSTLDGRVLELAENDYRYGAGTLKIKVERVDRDHPVRSDGEDWYPIDGIRIGYNGVELDRQLVLVRARRIPAPNGP